MSVLNYQDGRLDKNSCVDPTVVRAVLYCDVTETVYFCPSFMGSISNLNKGVYKKVRGTFTRACSDRIRGDGFKLAEIRFRLDKRKTFLTMRVKRHWNRIAREGVDASFLEVFQEGQGG